MKCLLIATAALASLPLFAQEREKPSTNETAVSQTSTAAESPLVAAAKRGKRLDGKKRLIITNESLKDAKGHVSTSNIQTDLPPLKSVAVKTEKDLIAEKENAKAQQAKKAAAEKQMKEAEAQRKARMARLADMNEGAEAGYGEEDPALVEGRLETTNQDPKKPQ